MRTISAILLFLVVWAPSAVCQELPRADSFFESNFVLPSKDSEDTVDNEAEAAPQAEPKSKASIPPPRLSQDLKPHAPAQQNSNRYPVTRVNLVVNGIQTGHLNAALKELLGITVANKIPVGTVTIVGIPTNFVETITPEWLALKQLGATITVKRRPPKKLELESSPSWVLDTSSGIIVLDGAVNLSDYLSDREVILPKNSGSAMARF